MTDKALPIKEGSAYLIREFPELDTDDLHKVKVIKVVKLGDGTVVVRYRYNWPLSITKDLEISKFIENAALGDRDG